MNSVNNSDSWAFSPFRPCPAGGHLDTAKIKTQTVDVKKLTAYGFI